MGFDGLFFGRLDFEDKNQRKSSKTMELMWNGSPNNLGKLCTDGSSGCNSHVKVYPARSSVLNNLGKLYTDGSSTLETTPFSMSCSKIT